MATFIDAVHSGHLQRWVIPGLNTWARPEAIADFDPMTQYNRTTGGLDPSPPGRIQTNKRRPTIPIT